MSIVFRLTAPRALAAAVLTFSLAAPAQAAPITLGSLSNADSSFGVETITRDSIAGLEWLDLGLTTAYSYNSATAQMGVGGLLEGWRVATGTEVTQMVTNGGLVGLTGSAAQTAFDSLVGLFNGMVDDLAGLGCTLVLNGIVEPGTAGPPATHGLGGVGLDRQPAGAGGCGPVQPGTEFITFGPVASLAIEDTTTVQDHNSISPLSSITVAGIFLVRDSATVPEPQGMALLALALAAAATAARRGRRTD